MRRTIDVLTHATNAIEDYRGTFPDHAETATSGPKTKKLASSLNINQLSQAHLF